jgi:hypothetical protein
MEENFRTKVEVEIDYDSEKPKGFDYNSRSSHAMIAYAVNICLRDWGIKGISFLMKDQVIQCSIELIDESSAEGDWDSYNFEITLKNNEVEVPSISLNSDIFPDQLSVCLENIQKVSRTEFTAEAKMSILSFPSGSDD